MKPKFMDFETDWEKIKENQLSFLVEKELGLGVDSRSEAENMPPEDRREEVLRILVNMAAFN